MTVKVAIAQINCIVGDIKGNCNKIFNYAKHAYELGADVLLTPELSMTGYPPEDLLLRDSFYIQADQALAELKQDLADLSGLHVVVGHPVQHEGSRFNAATVFSEGQLIGRYHKHDLPNYDVFDEQRYFTPDAQALVFNVKGLSFGVNICEDTWYNYAPDLARAAGAQVLLILNASPYHMGKQHLRIETMRSQVCRGAVAVVYANMVGGQDELVFDGSSFVLDARGHLMAQAGQFEEDLMVVEFDHQQPRALTLHPEQTVEQQVYRALVLGVRDYIAKNNFPGAIIGLSGGIDSALTLAIAVDALGADKVRTVMMPSQYTAEISRIDAQDMTSRLGVLHEEISIEPIFNTYLSTLVPHLGDADNKSNGCEPMVDTTEENIQARIRGNLLMALSNRSGAIVLTTGNKSEIATGYCTLYGDMAGGFGVIKDIVKTMVYRLCYYRNSLSEVIPERMITRPPSAELRPNQTDQDSLPAYDILDGIMQLYMEENRPVAEILAAGYSPEDVQRVVTLIKRNEYKRRQAPVGIRVTHRAFGRDWRYPITSKFLE